MQETTQKLTKHHQNIYNKFLATTRSRENKPFKIRKDFSKFEDENPEKVFHLRKLSMFFNRFSHISIDDFFSAPYDIYSSDESFDLKFYTSQRALKVYTLFIQKRVSIPPDNDDQLISIKKSLEYILKFCNNHNISITEYTSHTTGNIPSFIMHLKECKVNIYVLFGFTDFESILNKSDREHVEFMIGDIMKAIPSLRTLFAKSTLAKKFIHAGIHKIKQLQSV